MERALRPFVEQHRTRLCMAGPDIRLPAAKALLIAMALHELGTNAVKYGALSNDDGKIDVNWSLEQIEGKSRLLLHWRELGGPPVQPPSRAGFGTRMLDRAMRGERGEARIEFLPEGVRCTIEMAI
jgi:two-component sensor histidine kinase